MIYAEITRAVIVEEEGIGGKTVLKGTAERGEYVVNFEAKYDWDSLEYLTFLDDLREKIAESFDIKPTLVNIPADKLLTRMRAFSEIVKKNQSSIIQ